MEKEIQIRGRLISPDDLQFIRQLLFSEGHKGRTHISRRLCRIWQWQQANGAYREIACRDRFIGWDDHTRQDHLNLIVNNHRFLTLPWVKLTEEILPALRVCCKLQEKQGTECQNSF